MVSKVAVMALVAVLAVPILLGYGLSLNEESITEYKLTGTKTNVTDLLKNSIGYTYIHGDSYKLNTDFSIVHFNDEAAASPIYESYTTSYSSLPMEINKFNNVSSGATQGVNHPFFYEQFDYDPAIGYTTATVNAFINGSTQTLLTVPRFHSIYYSSTTQEYEITSYVSYNGGYAYQVYSGSADLRNFTYSSMTGGSFSGYREITRDSTSTYVDIAKGYHFTLDGTGNNVFSINLPEKSTSALLTINLDSITDNNFSMTLAPGNTIIEKKTTNGVISWDVRQGATRTPIYYDPSRNDNTYQIKFDFQFVKIAPDGGNHERKYYKTDIEYRYVGGWPALIGEANYYQKYNFETTTSTPATDPDIYMDHVGLNYPSILATRTPTVRLDDAVFAAFEYPVIFNKEYDPASFKTNPSTVIDNITRYGDSISFAGQVYSVDSSGNITVGTRSISVNKLTLDSIPMPGGYENRINGYVISTSNDPSTIIFYGTWLANITTDSQTANTYNKTVWNVGEFAWDGIDQNFLMVGLITCLGVFIALGIYLRKTKSSMWPLLIVCGCAAGLFICMI